MTLTELLGPRAKGAAAFMKQFAGQFGITTIDHPDRIPNTRRALAIAEFAREQGKLDPWRDAAMSAHWEKRMNIESDDDLRKIAEEVGLDPAAAIAAADAPKYQTIIDDVRAEANRIGVTGIPTWVFAEKFGVVGCQEFDVLADAAREAGAVRG